MRTRWKIACCNWSHPDAPHALAYLLLGDEMVGERFFNTWAEAVAWVDERRKAARWVGGAR